MATVKLGSAVLDEGLDTLDSDANKIVICSTEPTTYTQAATTYKLGEKSFGAGGCFGSPASYAEGRKVSSVAITDGSVTANGTPAYWAAIDDANSRLLATGGLSGGAAITSGQGFTLTSFTIDMSGLAAAITFPSAGASVDLRFDGDQYYDSSLASAPDQAHLLFHADGTDGSSTYTDSAGRHTLAAAVGKIDTAQSKFGGSSLLMDGLTALTVAGNPADFGFGTGDFTIDFWFRWSDRTGQQHMYQSIEAMQLYKHTDHTIRMYFTGDLIIGTTAVVNDTWYHIALARSSGSTKLFLNGTQEGSTYSDSNNYSVGVPVNLINVNCLGWVDEYRILKSTAAYTANFTPKSVAYNAQITGPLLHLSCSRASTGYAKNSDGTLTSFASNTLRIGTGTGLLVEDARTNTALQSQTLDHANWTKANCSVTANATTAPDGTSTADKHIGVGTGTQVQYQSVTTGGSAGTVSGYFKNAGYNYGFIGSGTTSSDRATMLVDLTTGTVVATDTSFGTPTGVVTSVETLANGWFRLSITQDGDVNLVQVGASSTSSPTWVNGAANYTGDGTSGVYAWGIQVEAGTFVSSYIPTTGASATRAADAITTTGGLLTLLTTLPQSLVIDVKRSAGSLVELAAIIADPTDAVPSLISRNHAIQGSWNGPSFGSGPNFDSGVNWVDGAKAGLAQNSGAMSVVAGGGTVVSDVTQTVFPSNVRLGATSAGVIAIELIRRATFWNSKLADATLQALTAPE